MAEQETKTEATIMARFDGKVTLITGGARGQGAAEARVLVAEGGKRRASATYWKRKVPHSPRSSEPPQIPPPGRHQEADWESAIADARRRFGGLHGLVNNAGVYSPRPDGHRRRPVRAPRPHQPARLLPRHESGGAGHGHAGGGSIVNISSGAGLRGSPWRSPTARPSGRCAA